MANITRMNELIDILSKANKAYYSDANEIMSNREYDELYDELQALEEESGIVLAASPTVNVGYEASSSLEKMAHEKKMLSLNKTKSVDELVEWLGEQEGLLSPKLDGLTVVITYDEGSLKLAVTRGDGVEGEVITKNAKTFIGIPLKIPYAGRLVLRGEAYITYGDFNKLNEEIDDAAKYKNPRNLCSGSVRNLDPSITKERRVRFKVFSMLGGIEHGFNKKRECMKWLGDIGFDVVHTEMVTGENLKDTMNSLMEELQNGDIPVDGLVLTYDDIKTCNLLGETAKYPKDSIAFKWSDELYDTELTGVEWNTSRTGLVNPVAVFSPVEISGTTVKRAALHNLDILDGLALGKGDKIRVYKANMIIPQVYENITRSGNIEYPKVCPVCGCGLKLETEGARVLRCVNDDCPAKNAKRIVHFAGKSGINIKGISEKTIEKLIATGIIRNEVDLLDIENYKDEILKLDGFKEKSFENLKKAIDGAKTMTLQRFISAMAFTGIGYTNAGKIAAALGFDVMKLFELTPEKINNIEGLGEVLTESFMAELSDENMKRRMREIIKRCKFKEITRTRNDEVDGKKFVITGNVNIFKNRDDLKQKIEISGGQVVSSVSSNTDFLINNDRESTSSKNKKAKELGIAIISEKDIAEMLGE
ncbi:DNA ligase (NAD+) [Eubacterium saphenum ATCC 49989]|nr:DNA ligase (NAD+) [Eubacterium saphenum ATCC 49989]